MKAISQSASYEVEYYQSLFIMVQYSLILIFYTKCSLLNSVHSLSKDPEICLVSGPASRQHSPSDSNLLKVDSTVDRSKKRIIFFGRTCCFIWPFLAANEHYWSKFQSASNDFKFGIWSIELQDLYLGS